MKRLRERKMVAAAAAVVVAVKAARHGVKHGLARHILFVLRKA